jgi:DNA-directed RNA polymerase specialized sigma24 family protein
VRCSESNAEKVGEQSKLGGIVEQGVELLSPSLRIALQSRETGGLSTQEAVEVLSFTKGALKGRVQRARARLILLLPIEI